MYCDFPTMNTLFVLGQSSRYALLQKYKGLVISTVVFFLMTYPIHELDCCNEGVWKLGYLDFSDRSTLESIMRNYVCHGQRITYRKRDRQIKTKLKLKIPSGINRDTRTRRQRGSSGTERGQVVTSKDRPKMT